MDTKLILHKLEILDAKKKQMRKETSELIELYLEDNMDTDFNEVLRTIGKVSELQALKLHYDYLGGSLRESKRTINKLLKRK